MLLKPNNFSTTSTPNFDIGIPFGALMQQSTSSTLAIERIKSKDFFASLFIDNSEFRKEFLSINDIDETTTLDDAYLIFNEKHLSIFQNKDNSFVRISIDSTKSKTSFKWARLLLTRINEFSREKSKEEAEKAIFFLESELSKSLNINTSDQLSNLLKDEIKQLMLTNVFDEYAFSIIDSPRVPLKKSSPIVSLYVGFGFIIGVFFSLFGIYIKILTKKNSILNA